MPVEADCPFARVARPVLHSAVEKLTGIAVVGMLADSNGLLLSLLGGGSAFEQQVAGSGPITPGFDFSEVVIGTNGIGTALALGHPIMVDAGEHYAAGGKSFSCGAAPVRGPDTDEILGLINFTCLAQDSSPLLLAMASSVAAQVERELMIADRAGLAISTCSEDPTALRALVMAERRRHTLRQRLHRTAIRAATTDVDCLLRQVTGVLAQLFPVEGVWVLRLQDSGVLRVVGVSGGVAADALGSPLPADTAAAIFQAAGEWSGCRQHGRPVTAGAPVVGAVASAGVRRSWSLPGALWMAGRWFVAADAGSTPGVSVQPAAGTAPRASAGTAPGWLQPGHCIVVAAMDAQPDGSAREVLAEIATACDNVSRFDEIRREASSDALTGLPNRRRFMELARDRLVQGRRDGRPMAVLMVDIDRFKQVNDVFGHATGDRVLTAVAKRIRSALRAGDIVGRIGGEEIAVVTGADAPDLAERVRRAVATTDLTTGRGRIRVTVSVGVAHRLRGDTDLSEVLDRADRALYTAKSDGRDRVVVATRPDATPGICDADEISAVLPYAARSP